MSLQGFRAELHALQRERSLGLMPLLDELCALMERHPDAIMGVTGRYRVRVAPTGEQRGFAVQGGGYTRLADDEPVDVTVIGREEDLLRLFRRELSPMKALLFGKVRIEGDKSALMQLAALL